MDLLDQKRRQLLEHTHILLIQSGSVWEAGQGTHLLPRERASKGGNLHQQTLTLLAHWPFSSPPK